MSILGQQHTDPVSPAQRSATQIKRQAARLAEQIVTQWERGFDQLWNNPQATPAEVLAELGTDAEAIFSLSAQTVTFMVGMLQSDDSDWAAETLARIQAKLADKPETTTHADGSVTIAAD